MVKSKLRSVGQCYHDFIVTKIVKIPELQSELFELIHEPSGASIMHIANEDPENLFCLSFQTIPYNSNGVAHILEHTVLCGSKKFPVKDPFFAMNRRSLNTFMNALTGADFTCYPAASQIPKDFYNLLEVYLDAVFHPNLNELSFMQEGVRLEFQDPQDPESPLEFKGIVYNEMKGALSSSSSRLSEAINAALFPDITYGVNSGGDPKTIPELTYDELLAFYHKFYHPSRCLFFFYGNMPLEKHLDFLHEHTLKDTARVARLPPIPFQPRYLEPQYFVNTYPIAPDEDLHEKAMIAFGWLTCHILEQKEVLALSILQIILMDTDASPLKMALLKSGLVKQASSFIDIELTEIPWVITVKGCAEKNADEIEAVIKQNLEQIVQEGIPLDLVENAIHQLEFGRSEITGDYAPFGLSLFMRSGLNKQHGADPEQGLMIHTLFKELRKEVLANPKYLTNLIQRYLIDNNHFVRLVMIPDPNQQAQEEKEEKELLEKMKASLTPEQRKKIVKKTEELKKFQKCQEEEDFDILPKISIKEVPFVPRHYDLIKEEVGVLEVYHHPTFTNDIIYADLGYDLPNLTEEEIFYLRLLTILLGQVGCNGRNYIENLDYMQGNTGGLNAGISLNLQAKDFNQFSPTFHLRGKALHRKMQKLFPLMIDTLTSSNLKDIDRIKEILVKHFSGMESRLSQSALKYALNQACAPLSVAGKVINDLYGLPYYLKLRHIVQNFDTEKAKILEKLNKIQNKVLGLDHPHLIISSDAIIYDEIKRHGFYGMSDLETKPFKPWVGDFPLPPIVPEGRIIASPVAFITHIVPTVPYIHPQAPALNIASFLFDNLELHSRIREQGGAYGGGAVSNLMMGNFYFYSYRDPNISKTLEAFNEAVGTVAKGKFDETDLEEAKLEMIQSLDTPVAPGSRAEHAYGWLREGKTLEMRQAFRKQILEMTKKGVIDAVKDILVPQMNDGNTVVFAGKSLLEKEGEGLRIESI